MKTSINMDTLQFAIWPCLLDCPPPDRSAGTQHAVPNQLFIPFPYCHNRPSLCSLRQGCRGVDGTHLRPENISPPEPNTEDHRVLTFPCSVLSSDLPSCQGWGGLCATVLSTTASETRPGWNPASPATIILERRLTSFIPVSPPIKLGWS